MEKEQNLYTHLKCKFYKIYANIKRFISYNKPTCNLIGTILI